MSTRLSGRRGGRRWRWGAEIDDAPSGRNASGPGTRPREERLVVFALEPIGPFDAPLQNWQKSVHWNRRTLDIASESLLGSFDDKDRIIPVFPACPLNPDICDSIERDFWACSAFEILTTQRDQTRTRQVNDANYQNHAPNNDKQSHFPGANAVQNSDRMNLRNNYHQSKRQHCTHAGNRQQPCVIDDNSLSLKLAGYCIRPILQNFGPSDA